MACSSIAIPFDLYPCPPRLRFRMLDVRGVVSNLEKREKSFSFTIGGYPSKMEFFDVPPGWLNNGCYVKIDIDGDAVSIENIQQEIISKTPKNP